MSEWRVLVESMIPMGEIGERMVVVKVDGMVSTYSLMQAPMMKVHQAGESFGPEEIFMTSGCSSLFSKNEIDQFLI